MTTPKPRTPRTGGHSAKNEPPAGSPITQQSSQETTIMDHPSSVDQTPTLLARRVRPGRVGAEHHGLILGPASDTGSTATPAPMPATLTTAHAEIRRLRTDLATALMRLTEADAYIEFVERERDDAFADADHWRELAGGVA